MLKTISASTNKKLGGCAATYRSGRSCVYSTCPDSCPLKPEGKQGSTSIDQEYLQAVLGAVPRGGVSWTYTHFGVEQIPKHQNGQTVVNVSADSYEQAVEFIAKGYPTVVAVGQDLTDKVDRVQGVRFVRCPAEYNERVNCNNCGSGSPLCARPDRDYVVKFTAHGPQAKKVASDTLGGCYGASGPVSIHWHRTMGSEQTLSDAEVLQEFVRRLPYGTKIRHHVVGDFG